MVSDYKLTDKADRMDRTWEERAYLETLVPIKPGMSILDAGCGTGSWGKYLLEKYPGIKVTGLDNSPDATRYVDNIDGYTFITGDLTTLNNSGGLLGKHYDIIFLLHVLSHLPYPQWSVLLLRLYLLSGKGKIVLIGPNLFYVRICQLLSFLHLIPPFRFDPTAKWLFTKGRLQKVLKKTGFKDIHVEYWGGRPRKLPLKLFSFRVIAVATK